MRTLNAGCGGTLPNHRDIWKGDVRLDIRPSPNVSVVGDINNLPFKDDSFDVTMMYDVIEHMESPIRALREIRRVSKRLEIITPNPLHWERQISFARNPMRSIRRGRDTRHYYTWTRVSYTHLTLPTTPYV